MYIKRHLEEQILTASRSYPVIMVCGQRQVGKSTMLNHIKEADRSYITLDDWNARRLAETDAALFFETYGCKLLIDEIQRVPSLLLEIKRIVDERALRGEDNSGMFWLTGSQKFHMMKGVSESLAGRAALFELSGLSASELDERPLWQFSPEIDTLKQRVQNAKIKTTHEIFEEILHGSMPRLRTMDIDRDRFYADYINTYLNRDVRELSQVGKLSEFQDFLVFMASRTGQELKYADISRSIGVSAPTAKAWVSILEASGIIFVLRPYYANIAKRLVKTPKVYFMDTGLAAHLCRWSSAETLEAGPMSGAFLETYVVSEIVKSIYNSGRTPDLYYYRDAEKKEIDLLMVKDRCIYPIEVKKGKQPSDADKNFYVLSSFDLTVMPGVILCMCDRMLPYSRKAWYYPISAI